jgi:hypothetical protein
VMGAVERSDINNPARAMIGASPGRDTVRTQGARLGPT